MDYAPFGIFALIAVTVGVHGIKVLLPLIKLILVMYTVALLHILVVYIPFIRFVGRMRPGSFFRGVAEPLLVAFTTCSSAAALPLKLTRGRKTRCTPDNQQLLVFLVLL